LLGLEAGLSIDEIWDLTPVEVQLVVRAFNRGLHRQRLWLCELQANLMNYMRGCLGAKGPRITVNRLMGCKSFSHEMTRQEITEYFQQKRERGR
jgi:hypothetical protein